MSTDYGDNVEMSGVKVPKSVIILIFRYLDRATLSHVALVCKKFSQFTRHSSLRTPYYSGPHGGLPKLQAIIPFPPPAVLQTTLPQVTTVNPTPQLNVTLPKSTNVIVPVLPETVPIIAQVPDVVTNSDSGVRDGEKVEVVQISQVLPGYAPSYANDYIPPLVNDHSFSTFANTISFNVSRYPTLSEVTDSKKYSGKLKKNEDDHDGDKKDDNKHKNSGDNEEVKVANIINNITQHCHTSIEYVPAEYFRGAESERISTVSGRQSVGYVKPDVLASGRLLNCMVSIGPITQSSTSTTVTGYSNGVGPSQDNFDDANGTTDELNSDKS